MNLHGSVLLLNVTFLLSSQMALPTVPRPVCTVLAATLHYALLSSLTWMAIEGFNLYLLLGRVYNVYIRRYLLKLCVLGWGKGHRSHWPLELPVYRAPTPSPPAFHSGHL